MKSLVAEFDASYAAVSVPVPPAVDITDTDGFPIVGTPEERLDAHGSTRVRFLDETGTASGSTGVVRYYRPEVTDDGVHPHATGRAEIGAAVAELRAMVSAGARG